MCGSVALSIFTLLCNTPPALNRLAKGKGCTRGTRPRSPRAVPGSHHPTFCLRALLITPGIPSLVFLSLKWKESEEPWGAEGEEGSGSLFRAVPIQSAISPFKSRGSTDWSWRRRGGKTAVGQDGVQVWLCHTCCGCSGTLSGPRSLSFPSAQ